MNESMHAGHHGQAAAHHESEHAGALRRKARSSRRTATPSLRRRRGWLRARPATTRVSGTCTRSRSATGSGRRRWRWPRRASTGPSSTSGCSPSTRGPLRSRSAPAVVISAGYRLAPRTPLPGRAARRLRCAGLDGRARSRAGRRPGADRAGWRCGHVTSRGPPIGFQLLNQPGLDDRQETWSARHSTGTPWMNRDKVTAAWRHYLGSARASPYAAPARAVDLSGCCAVTASGIIWLAALVAGTGRGGDPHLAGTLDGRHRCGARRTRPRGHRQQVNESVGCDTTGAASGSSSPGLPPAAFADGWCGQLDNSGLGAPGALPEGLDLPPRCATARSCAKLAVLS